MFSVRRMEHKKPIENRTPVYFCLHHEFYTFLSIFRHFCCFAAQFLLFFTMFSGVQKYVWKDVIHTVGQVDLSTCWQVNTNQANHYWSLVIFLHYKLLTLGKTEQFFVFFSSSSFFCFLLRSQFTLKFYLFICFFVVMFCNMLNPIPARGRGGGRSALPNLNI